MSGWVSTISLANYPHVVIMVFFLCWSMGCSSHDDLSESFKIENEVSQNRLIKELRQKNITIKIDNGNRVWFSSLDREKVHGVARQVMDASSPDRVSFHYDNPKYTNMLERRLRENDIPFETIIMDNGIKQLVLYQNSIHIWGKLKAEVDELYKRELRAKYGIPTNEP